MASYKLNITYKDTLDHKELLLDGNIMAIAQKIEGDWYIMSPFNEDHLTLIEPVYLTMDQAIHSALWNYAIYECMMKTLHIGEKKL